MSESPEVSVVTATRNRWPLLSLTLRGVLRQEDVDLEALVVDDGSEDGTPDRLLEIEDPRVRVLRNERAPSVARARNVGLAEARGDWVAFLDDDDLWSPHKLRTQLDAATAAGASLVYGGAVMIDERGAVIGRDLPPPDPDDLVRAMLERFAIPGGGSNLMARADLVRAVGDFDEELRFDDWDMYIRLAAAGRAVACSEVLVAYRRHRGNRVLGDADDLTPELERVAAKHRALCEEYGTQPDRRGFTRWRAWTHRRAGRRFHAARDYLRGAWRYRDPGSLIRALAVLVGDWRPPRDRRPPDPPEWLEQYP